MKHWIFAASLALCLMLHGCAVQKLLEFVPDTIAAETVLPEETTAHISLETEPEQTLPPETLAETTEPAAPELPVLPEPESDAFVRITDYIRDLPVDLKYASQDNFTGQVIYDFQDVYLRYGTVQKLLLVQEELISYGYGIKIWDGFRPVDAQFVLWQVCPDPTYVANPETGYSSHSRGNTVDLTLVDAEGREVEMPTGFDDFSSMADRDYSDCPAVEAENARLLQQIMEKYGFKGYYGEWWHFSDVQSYPVEEVFRPVDTKWYYADCEKYINLRIAADASSESLIRIPAGEEFLLLAHCGDFALADYQGFRGYVHRGYIRPADE